MRFNCILMVAFLVTGAEAATDINTFHLEFECSLRNNFTVSAYGLEVDSVTDDIGEVQDFECETSPCSLNVTYSDNGDGMFDNEYELQLHLTHDCTADQNKAEVLLKNPEDKVDGFWRVSIGKNNDIDVNFKV